MADNVPITAGSGTSIAADDIASVFYQRVKLALGADGSAVDAIAGAGNVSTAVQRVTIADDDTNLAAIKTSVQLLDDAIFTDDAAYTPATSKLLVIGAQADETAADSVDEGDAGALRMTLARAIHTNKRNSSGAEDAYGVGNVGTTVPRVTVAADGPGGYMGKSASATFTPAASSHTAGDCNGAAAEFAFGAPSACTFMITDAELEIDGGTAEATAWRLHLYTVTPPSATADDGAWDLVSGDRSSYLGYIDLGTAIDVGSTQWVENHGVNKAVKLSGTSVFGYLVNLTTLTPAAVAHIVKLYGTPL